MTTPLSPVTPSGPGLHLWCGPDETLSAQGDQVAIALSPDGRSLRVQGVLGATVVVSRTCPAGTTTQTYAWTAAGPQLQAQPAVEATTVISEEPAVSTPSVPVPTTAAVTLGGPAVAAFVMRGDAKVGSHALGVTVSGSSSATLVVAHVDEGQLTVTGLVRDHEGHLRLDDQAIAEFAARLRGDLPPNAFGDAPWADLVAAWRERAIAATAQSAPPASALREAPQWPPVLQGADGLYAQAFDGHGERQPTSVSALDDAGRAILVHRVMPDGPVYAIYLKTGSQYTLQSGSTRHGWEAMPTGHLVALSEDDEHAMARRGVAVELKEVSIGTVRRKPAVPDAAPVVEALEVETFADAPEMDDAGPPPWAENDMPMYDDGSMGLPSADTGRSRGDYAEPSVETVGERTAGTWRRPTDGGISIASWHQRMPAGGLWVGELLEAVADSSEELDRLLLLTHVAALRKGLGLTQVGRELITQALQGPLATRLAETWILVDNGMSYFARPTGDTVRVVGPRGASVKSLHILRQIADRFQVAPKKGIDSPTSAVQFPGQGTRRR